MKRLLLFLVITAMGVSAVMAQGEKKSKKELKREFIAQGVQYAKAVIESGEFRITAGGLVDEKIARQLRLDVFRTNTKPATIDYETRSKDTTYRYGFTADQYSTEISLEGKTGKIKVRYSVSGRRTSKKLWMSILDVCPLVGEYIALHPDEITLMHRSYSPTNSNLAYIAQRYSDLSLLNSTSFDIYLNHARMY